MTLRCVLYARYSPDQQRAAFIEDQFRVCREHVEREGWKIAGAYRDTADVATLYKHLHFAGVMVVTFAEGEISELYVGLKGTMNALFLKDLAAKTRRGLRGRAAVGGATATTCRGT